MRFQQRFSRVGCLPFRFCHGFDPSLRTFKVPAELLPARFRSTCHVISTEAGKAGAIIGAFWVQNFTQEVSGIKTAIKVLAVVTMLGFVFTFLVLETKGRSPKDISGEDVDSGGAINGRIEDGNSTADGAAAPETKMV